MAIPQPVETPDAEETYLTTAEVAARYRTKEPTVRRWQMIGYGPKSIKVGRRRLYALSECLRFEQKLGICEGVT
jgi:DNA-binding transcriptional MerR regulator